MCGKALFKTVSCSRWRDHGRAHDRQL